jgi:hypothetical protein
MFYHAGQIDSYFLLYNYLFKPMAGATVINACCLHSIASFNNYLYHE